MGSEREGIGFWKIQLFVMVLLRDDTATDTTQTFFTKRQKIRRVIQHLHTFKTLHGQVKKIWSIEGLVVKLDGGWNSKLVARPLATTALVSSNSDIPQKS